MIVAWALSLFLLSSPASPQEGSLTIDALIDIRHPSSPVWSTDGRQVAYVWNRAGVENVWLVDLWLPVPYLDHRMAEELFRHHVFRLLQAQGLLSDERIELLRSWKSAGFNADDSVRIPAGESKTLEHVARYVLR